MSKNTRYLCLALILSLGGCAAGAATSAVTPVVATVTADVAKAESIYATIKGIAQVDALAQPANAPAINAVIAKLDPYAAALAAGTPVLAGTAVTAAGLVDQATSLLTTSTQQVKVVLAPVS